MAILYGERDPLTFNVFTFFITRVHAWNVSRVKENRNNVQRKTRKNKQEKKAQRE